MHKGLVSNRALYELLEHGASGEVMAVFSSAVYFKLSDKTCMLHDMAYGTIPFGISLPDINGNARNLGLEPGMKLRAKCGYLSTEAAFQMQISYKQSLTHPAKLSQLRSFAENAQRVLSDTQRSELRVYCAGNIAEVDKSKIEDIFAKTAYTGLLGLEQAMLENKPEAIEKALQKLIGLGRGLTPSLDDFLCGLVFVLLYAAREWHCSIPSLSALVAGIRTIAPRQTNEYSMAYLLSAAAGEDFSLMRECLENSGSDEACKSIEALLMVGASSGADMLSGMCFASNYILKQR